MTSMNRYLVARPVGADLSDTYATELDGDQDLCLAYLVEEVAMWPDGTHLETWVVSETDVGFARTAPPSKREAGSAINRLVWHSAA